MEDECDTFNRGDEEATATTKTCNGCTARVMHAKTCRLCVAAYCTAACSDAMLHLAGIDEDVCMRCISRLVEREMDEPAREALDDDELEIADPRRDYDGVSCNVCLDAEGEWECGWCGELACSDHVRRCQGAECLERVCEHCGREDEEAGRFLCPDCDEDV
jgi:hypothetical protein